MGKMAVGKSAATEATMVGRKSSELGCFCEFLSVGAQQQPCESVGSRTRLSSAARVTVTARIVSHSRALYLVSENESSYICDACGEEIVIPVDLSAGETQEYVEDCPVCCR